MGKNMSRMMLVAGLMTALTAMPAVGAPTDQPAAKPLLQQQSVEQLPDPVAKVNGVPISSQDFTGNRNIPAGTKVSTEQLQKINQQVLQRVIAHELLFQAAEKQKFTISDLDKQVQEQLAQVKKKFKDDAAYNKALTDGKTTEERLKASLRKAVVVQQFVAKTLTADIVVSDKELQDFYDKNPDAVTRPEQVKASHILIAVAANATDDDKKKARKKAEDLRKRLVKGEDFATLAKENSACPTGKNGGDLGYFAKGKMVKPFEEAVWKMKAGELSQVVETPFGYHLIKFYDRKPQEKLKFADVKSNIAQLLKQRKAAEKVNAYVQELQKKAKVEVYLK